MSPIEIESRDLGSVVEIYLRGAADLANASSLEEELRAAIAPERDVLVRCGGLERLDGAAIQILLAAQSQVERGGRWLAVPPEGDVAMNAIAVAGATSLLATSYQR